MPDTTEETRRWSRVLWDFHSVESLLPEKVDVIVAAGCHDERVAVRAAGLLSAGKAQLLVITGGFGKITKGLWKIPEAEKFAEKAVKNGIDPSLILIEPKASHTFENITFSRALLEDVGVLCRSVILVTRPYLQRRALAAAEKIWPEVEWFVTAPQLCFEECPNSFVDEARMTALMVGDVERLQIYAQQGSIVKHEIPQSVYAAYKALVASGFTEYCINK